MIQKDSRVLWKLEGWKVITKETLNFYECCHFTLVSILFELIFDVKLEETFHLVFYHFCNCRVPLQSLLDENITSCFIILPFIFKTC